MTKKHICKLSATVIKYIFIQYLLLIIISIELYYVEHCTDFQIGYHHPHFWIHVDFRVVFAFFSYNR